LALKSSFLDSHNNNFGESGELVTLQMPRQIKSADADAFARLSMGSLVNILVEAAIESADSLGFGYSGLRKDRLFWVLSRLSLEIRSQVNWYDRLIVETWPKDIDGLHYLRDFIIRTDSGEEKIRATSAWLAIDLETKKIRSLEGELSETLQRRSDYHALEYLPEKLRPVKNGDTYSVKSCYYDLDLNGHTTSARYVDWMMDTLPMDFHREHYPEYLSINFLRETMYGNELNLLRQTDNGLNYQFEGTNMTLQTSSFRGKIKFR
jgi:medium-chain acyl-[acyl-carrier-protein] hydrolase